MSAVVKKKLLAVLCVFVAAIVMQFIGVADNATMSWVSLAIMAVASAFLYVCC